MKIANQYNCVENYKGGYNIYLRHVIRDTSFTCNTRDALDSYPQQAYVMSCGFPNDDLPYHTTVLVPLIQIPFVGGEQMGTAPAPEDYTDLRYLEYLSSFAHYGHTNTNGAGSRGWPVVNGSGPLFSHVMKHSPDGWDLVEDDQNSKDACSFCHSIVQDIMYPQAHPGWKMEDMDMNTDFHKELEGW
ncbi:hypothetical protein NM208_g6408 [Fusarium decemcellulare]|uniref:Uncharacterized protein n=1 Tax=Fusarium decemcellulare TaxID=57161 RepID=A0ACC1SDE4_9HYPO|nr:hypothetical protein NM208_g6408 [Fusarium decemcellulare]